MKAMLFKGENVKKIMSKKHSGNRSEKKKNMKEEIEPPSKKKNGLIRKFINLFGNRNTDRHISNSLLLIHSSPVGCPIGYPLFSSNNNRILCC